MKIKAKDINGNIKEYDVILTYHSDEFNKDYIVYTDNIYNDNNELQIYINEYNDDNPIIISKKIDNEEEYNKIKTEINSILLSMKNESDKLDETIDYL